MVEGPRARRDGVSRGCSVLSSVGSRVFPGFSRPMRCTFLWQHTFKEWLVPQ